MEVGLQVLIGFALTLEVVALICSILLIYCTMKAQPLNKPPGSLILVEMILTIFAQIFQLIYTVLFLVAYETSYSLPYIFTTTFKATGAYCTFTNSNYEICIMIELYHYLKVGKNAKPFRKRAIIYHIVSHSISVVFTSILFGGYISMHPDEEMIAFEYNEWIFWFNISCHIISFIIFFTFAVLTAHKQSKLPDSYTKRFINKIMWYITAIVTIRLATIIFISIFDFLFKSIEPIDDSYADVLYGNFFALKNLMLYLLRLNDPYMREFIRHRVKVIKYIIIDKVNEIRNSRDNPSTLTINQNLIPMRKFFDDILIEKIEYQLIAISIAMLKEQDI